MTTIRVHKKDRYTAVARESINDTRLSFRARGILVWLLDKPNDWRCDSTQIASQTKEGRDAVRAALRELEAAGYLVRQRSQDERGRWVQSCVIYEVPPETGFQAPENQAPENQSSVDQSSVPQALLQRLSPTTVNKTPRRERASTEEPDGFAHWYDRYPRKEGRKFAARAFRAALKHASLQDLNDGLDRYLRFITATNRAREYIKTPAAWLNGGHWQDEYAAQVQRKPEPVWMRAR